ncbi:MAG: YicC/YloC family endoribonuclease [Pseudomonadota bacterium]
MTGFGRAVGELAEGSWAWEAKSVNGRGLDVRANVPGGFEPLQSVAKSKAGKRFSRGSLQISLRIELVESAGRITVNQQALTDLVAVHTAQSQGELPSGEALATLMTARGVLQESQGSLRDLASDEEIMSALQAGLITALDALADARREEGASLHTVLSAAVDQMQAICREAETHAGEQPALLKARLNKQLADLGAEQAVDADRLAAEVALSAAKADVREELDRLDAHFVSAKALLAEGSPIGRKLDFLAQELNREANTLCSKSASLDLTNAGLGLKALIDQFKEQAANVE